MSAMHITHFSGDTVLAASAVNVFIGGSETTSITISFFFYELARNPQVQKKLRKEIVEVIEKHGGLTYKALSEMKYLDMCLNGKN